MYDFKKETQMLLAAIALVSALATQGCDQGDEPHNSIDVGSIDLAINDVPPDVTCIRITVAGRRSEVRHFDVDPGDHVNLHLNGLPLGDILVSGEAFEQECSTIDNRTVPVWIADAVGAVIRADLVPSVILHFVDNGMASLCLDFDVSYSDDPIYLTSMTLDPEDETGTTTNAPGAWSTNQADPVSQIAVIMNGEVLNIGSELGEIGELELPLHMGLNSMTLVGNGVFPGNLYYGLILYFNGIADPPQIAVYNDNPTPPDGSVEFQVQPLGSPVIGSANGGLFITEAPGTHLWEADDGTIVEVVGYTINAASSTSDEISFGRLVPDETPDSSFSVLLNVRPSCL